MIKAFKLFANYVHSSAREVLEFFKDIDPETAKKILSKGIP
jgi:hypothetical protein